MLDVDSTVVYSTYEPIPSSTAARRSDDEDIALIMVGRIFPWKGQVEVCEAFARAFPAPSR